MNIDNKLPNKMNEIDEQLPKKNAFSMQLDPSLFRAAKKEELDAQNDMGEGISLFKDGMSKLKKNKLAMASLVVLGILLIAIIVAPLIVPYGYDEILSINGVRDDGAQNLGPFCYSEAEKEYMANGGSRFPHIFGTDEISRDYFIRVIYGTRVSFAVGIFASLIVLVVGMIYGSISGYVGGKVDMVMMRIVDIIYSLPDMLIIILMSVVLSDGLNFEVGSVFSRLGGNLISMFIVFGALYWVSMARVVRGQVLSIKSYDYITAAKLMGAKPSFIIRKHILPNCLSVIIVSTALEVPSAIFIESYLSFIGLGIQAPMPSLGSLANAARSGIMSYSYKLVIPAVFICLIVLSLNLLCDGLRDAFDPKLKR